MPEPPKSLQSLVIQVLTIFKNTANFMTVILDFAKLTYQYQNKCGHVKNFRTSIKITNVQADYIPAICFVDSMLASVIESMLLRLWLSACLICCFKAMINNWTFWMQFASIKCPFFEHEKVTQSFTCLEKKNFSFEAQKHIM